MACRLEKWVLQQLLQFRVYPQGPGAETAAPGRARGSGPAPPARADMPASSGHVRRHGVVGQKAAPWPPELRLCGRGWDMIAPGRGKERSSQCRCSKRPFQHRPELDSW